MLKKLVSQKNSSVCKKLRATNNSNPTCDASMFVENFSFNIFHLLCHKLHMLLQKYRVDQNILFDSLSCGEKCEIGEGILVDHSQLRLLHNITHFLIHNISFIRLLMKRIHIMSEEEHIF